MRLFFAMLLLSGCTHTVTCGGPSADSYSKKEIEQAFKERDAFLAKLQEQLLRMEKKDEK